VRDAGGERRSDLVVGHRADESEHDSLAPGGPRRPALPFNAATAFLDKSTFYSEPFTTCAEPTLFLGTSLTTA
jgi:hypothetical protein